MGVRTPESRELEHTQVYRTGHMNSVSVCVYLLINVYRIDVLYVVFARDFCSLQSSSEFIS